MRRVVFADVQTARSEDSIIRASIPTKREEVGRIPDSQGIWGSLPLRTLLNSSLNPIFMSPLDRSEVPHCHNLTLEVFLLLQLLARRSSTRF